MTDLKQPLTPEILVPRLGDYLIEQKLITPDQLTYALQQQSAIRKTQTEVPLLGQVMVELGIIDRAVLDRATGRAVAPNGSLGHRFGEEGVGRWNLELGDIDPAMTLYTQGGESVLGHDRVVGQLLEDADGDHLVDLAVLDHQDPRARDPSAPAPDRPRAPVAGRAPSRSPRAARPSPPA